MCSRGCWSNRADEADEPSVVELSVKLDEVIECAYEDVDEAETYSPDDFGVGVGLFPLAGLGLAST